MKKASVVIITYKRPVSILFRAVHSVLSQDYSNLEVFIVNDAPEDIELSRKIQKEIESTGDVRLHYLSYDRNHGSNYARNYGLKYCSGEYVAFLDDDDEWYKNKLSRQIAVMEADDSVGLVSCAFDISNGTKFVGKKLSNPAYNDSIETLLRFNYIGGSSFPILRRSMLTQIGGFDENMKACQEYELWIRMREISSFKSIDEALGIYYVSSDSTYKGKPDKYYSGDSYILQKHQALFSRYKKAYNSHLNGMALQWLLRRRIKWYFEYKAKAIRLDPLTLQNLSILSKIIGKVKRTQK